MVDQLAIKCTARIKTMLTQLKRLWYRLIGKIEWNLVVVITDNIPDRLTRGPVMEAVKFIENNSKFVFNVQFIRTDLPNSPFSYPDDNGQMVYEVLRDQIHPNVIANLPVAHSYVFFFRLFGLPPARAGSTMGVADGIMAGGKSRPYATMCTDVWWFNLLKEGGFNSRAGSIIAHEVINTLFCVMEVAPFNCPTAQTTNSPDPAITEGNRLRGISDACYTKLRTSRR